MGEVRRSLALADGEISYLGWDGPGPDAPRLLFAHANGFNALTYRHMLTPLAAHFSIRALDMRGHGRSTVRADPKTHWNWTVYRDDLIAVLEDWGGPALLAGHSMGGASSVLAARKRPDLVLGLALLEPVFPPPAVAYSAFLRGLLTGRGLESDVVKQAARRRAIWPDRDALFASYKGRGVFKTWPDDVLRDYIDGGTRDVPGGQVELACAPAWEAANFGAQGNTTWWAFARWRGPLRVLLADQGSTSRGGAEQLMRRLQPRAHIERIAGTHCLPMEDPVRAREEILAVARDANLIG